MTAEDSTRRDGGGGTQIVSHTSAADGDTVMLIPDEPESVRVAPADELPKTERSGANAHIPTFRERFEDQGEIARGGMGAVHRVFDRAILRTAAQKRLNAAGQLVPGARARFLEEAQITGQLDHPNIVPVYDIGVDDSGGVGFITMKLVRGKTLRELAADAHADGLTGARIEALMQIFLKVCDALSFAHSRGVLHRDLKPDNVMVGSHGQVYLMDWGIASLRGGSRPSALQVNARALGSSDEDRLDAGATIVGTPAYMAPEQALGGELDERTDVFGMGTILYRILTNRAPFAAKSSELALALARAGSVTPPDEQPGNPRLPPGLTRIAMKALSADRSLRHPSVDALREDVATFLKGGGWFRTLHFREGTVIVREGDTPDAAYIITAGTCEAYKSHDGVRRTLRRMGPREVFGETSIFTSQPRTASVVALTDVEVTEITLEALEQELGGHSWTNTFVRALAERFLSVNRELEELRAKANEEE
jgi:serine/threonine-protein kinase